MIKCRTSVSKNRDSSVRQRFDFAATKDKFISFTYLEILWLYLFPENCCW